MKRQSLKEGSKRDEREDKLLARRAGMSMKEWERSKQDRSHDEGKLPRVKARR